MAIPKEVLDDLSSRFLMSLPAEEREDPVRVCFQAERAHWFYIDNLPYYTEEVAKSATCPKCNVREFIRQIFQHCSFLKRHSKEIDSILEKWRDYKGVIPTHGAILLDESLDYVLLVQGYHAKASWGFPKGKCNEEESPHHCAIREVKEETGFDISPLINENDFLERTIMETPNRLYIVPGVPRDYAFKPTTRNEIKECRWFMLDTLPTSRTDNSKSDLGIYPNNFYMVFPYVEQMKKWVMQRRGGRQSSASSRIQGGSSTATTPSVANGDYRHHQQHFYYDQRGNRSSPRTRSISHSSPTFYSGGANGDYNNRHGYNSGYASDKYQRQSSSTKQQQKKNKKTSTVVRQKLDFDSSGDGKMPNAVSPKPNGASTKQPANNRAKATSSAESIAGSVAKIAMEKLEIQPSKTWQQFHFNWEPIFSAM